MSDARGSEVYEATARELERAAAGMPLTSEEVAARFTLDVVTVNRYAAAGRLVPSEKAGNRWRFGLDVQLVPKQNRRRAAPVPKPRLVRDAPPQQSLRDLARSLARGR
jgi:hypothetical protein